MAGDSQVEAVELPCSLVLSPAASCARCPSEGPMGAARLAWWRGSRPDSPRAFTPRTPAATTHRCDDWMHGGGAARRSLAGVRTVGLGRGRSGGGACAASAVDTWAMWEWAVEGRNGCVRSGVLELSHLVDPFVRCGNVARLIWRQIGESELDRREYAGGETHA